MEMDAAREPTEQVEPDAATEAVADAGLEPAAVFAAESGEDAAEPTQEPGAEAQDEEPAQEEPAEAEWTEADAVPPAPAPVPEPEPEPEPAAVVAAPAAPTTGEAVMRRVESFLAELRTTLLDLAQRQPTPPPPPVDMQAIVDAIGEFGERVEHGVTTGVHAALSSRQPPAPAAAAPLTVIQPRPQTANAIMLTVAFLLLCWGGVLWLKTGSLELAVATFLGANLVGCGLLLGRK